MWVGMQFVENGHDNLKIKKKKSSESHNFLVNQYI